MNAKITLLAAALLFTAQAADAKTVPLVDRGITLDEGQFHAGLDLDLGMDSGRVAKSFRIGTRYLHDRRDGITFGYGILDQLQVGADIRALTWVDGPGLDFGGADLYVAYAFLPFLGAELNIIIPPKNFSDNRVWFSLGIPFKYTVVEGLVAVFLRPDITFMPIKDNFSISLFADLGATFNFTPEFFAELYFGIGKLLKPSGADPTIPVGVKLGYTVAEMVDLSLYWNFDDLKGQKADARSIGLGADFLF